MNLHGLILAMPPEIYVSPHVLYGHIELGISPP